MIKGIWKSGAGFSNALRDNKKMAQGKSLSLPPKNSGLFRCPDKGQIV